MKKTILATAVLLSLGTSAQALSIDITEMQYYDANGDFDFAQTGQPNTTVLFNSSLAGLMYSDSPFFGITWDAYQVMWDETVTGAAVNWSGATASGSYSYDYTLNTGEVAIGLMFNLGTSLDVAILQIFDCSDAVNCTSVNSDLTHPNVPGSEMINGPWPGQHVTFSGLAIVPVPAAVWLFGSGLLGLLGVARRRKAA